MFVLGLNILTSTPLSNPFLILLALLFFFGGLTFTIYPLSISYALDYLQSKDTIAAIQVLLLAYSGGATVGPLLLIAARDYARWRRLRGLLFISSLSPVY